MFQNLEVLAVLTQWANNLKAEIYFGSIRCFQKCQDFVKVPFLKKLCFFCNTSFILKNLKI